MSSQQAPLALQVHQAGCSCCHTRLTARAHTHAAGVLCPPYGPRLSGCIPAWPRLTLSRGHGTTLLCVLSKDIQDFFSERAVPLNLPPKCQGVAQTWILVGRRHRYLGTLSWLVSQRDRHPGAAGQAPGPRAAPLPGNLLHPSGPASSSDPISAPAPDQPPACPAPPGAPTSPSPSWFTITPGWLVVLCTWKYSARPYFYSQICQVLLKSFSPCRFFKNAIYLCFLKEESYKSLGFFPLQIRRLGFSYSIQLLFLL